MLFFCILAQPLAQPLPDKGTQWRTADSHYDAAIVRTIHLEAFTNLYSDIADAVLARRDGVAADPLVYLFPTVEDGVQGVKFIDAAVVSHQQDGRWVDATVDTHEY